MKLRGRRKEEEPCHRVLRSLQSGRSQSPPSSHFCPLLPSSFPSSSPSTHPTSRHPPPLQFLLRHGPGEQYSPAILSPAVPPLPFFFIKLLKQQSVEGRTVAGTYLADPAVLLNDNRARPARRTFAPSPNRVAGCFSLALMAASLWRLEP